MSHDVTGDTCQSTKDPAVPSRVLPFAEYITESFVFLLRHVIGSSSCSVRRWTVKCWFCGGGHIVVAEGFAFPTSCLRIDFAEILRSMSCFRACYFVAEGIRKSQFVRSTHILSPAVKHASVRSSWHVYPLMSIRISSNSAGTPPFTSF